MGANVVYVQEQQFTDHVLPRCEEAGWEVGTADHGATLKRIIGNKLGPVKADFILRPLQHGDIVIYRDNDGEHHGMVRLEKGRLRLYTSQATCFRNTIDLHDIVLRRADETAMDPEQLAAMRAWVIGDGLINVTVTAQDPDPTFLRRMLRARAERADLPGGRTVFRLKMTHQAYRILRARCTGYRWSKDRWNREPAAVVYDGTYEVTRG
jgi:hypothetical protein